MSERNRIRRVSGWLTSLVLLFGLTTVAANAQTDEPLISMVIRDTELAEVMEMLSRAERVNILLSEGVGGEVSFSLYDVPLSEAIRSISSAAGYAAERRNGTYFIVERDEVGDYAASDLTQVQTFHIQYTDPAQLQEMLRPYLSEYGELRTLIESKILMVEDTPSSLRQIATLVSEIDQQPKQILIEAKILEITLNSEDAYGIDWSNSHTDADGTTTVGTRGLEGAGSSGSAGLFFEIANLNLTAMLSALEQDGRIRTLSTPNLLALENQEASVVVGDRRGYKVTTTINQVTTESVEFLESGVILRVTAHVDSEGRVMMDIHPEVSTGVVDANGIPSQATTEVTTRLLVASGQSVFIGGLIKQTLSESRKGVPILGRIPGIRALFSNREVTSANTETIVVITPRVVSEINGPWNTEPQAEIEKLDRQLQQRATGIDEELRQDFSDADPIGGTGSLAESN